MKYQVYLLILSSIVAFAAAATNAGASASLDLSVVDQAKEVYFNYVMNILKQVKIPDTSFHHGSIHDNTFFLQAPSRNVQIVNDPAHNGVRLSVNDLRAGFKSKHFRYKESIIVAKGSVDVSVSHCSVSVTVGLTQQTLPNGKVVPAFTTPEVSIDLPKDHIDIKVHGNVIAKIADAFKSFFKGPMRDVITKTLKDELHRELPKALNGIVAQQKGYSEIYNGLDLDWSIPSTPTVTDKALAFGIKGLFFPKGQAEVEPSVQPPAVPMADAGSSSKFQCFISNYLADSLGASYLQTNEVHFWTRPKDMPKSSPVQLDTTSLGNFFPGMEAHYGAGKPVDIEYKLERLGNFSMRENDSTLSFTGDLALKFWVETSDTDKDVAVDLTLQGMRFNFTVLVKPGTTALQMNVGSASLAGLHVESTTFGNLDLLLLAKLLNQGISLGLPVLNTYLSTVSLPLPTELFGLFTLSDLTLKYHDNYLEAGLTPTFKPITEDIPGVYERFVPMKDEPFYAPDKQGGFTTFFLEQLGEDGAYLESLKPGF